MSGLCYFRATGATAQHGEQDITQPRSIRGQLKEIRVLTKIHFLPIPYADAKPLIAALGGNNRIKSRVGSRLGFYRLILPSRFGIIVSEHPFLFPNQFIHNALTAG